MSILSRLQARPDIFIIKISKPGFEDIPFILLPALLVFLSALDPGAHIGSPVLALFGAGVLAAILLRFVVVITHHRAGPFGMRSAALTVMWALFIFYITANGLMHGWRNTDILRDVMRLLTIGVGLWLIPGFWTKWSARESCGLWIKALLAAGVFLSAHAWLIIYKFGGAAVLLSIISESMAGVEAPEEVMLLGTLVHDPVVLFAGLYMLGTGVAGLSFKPGIYKNVLVLALSILIMALWALTLTRSFMAMAFLVALFAFLQGKHVGKAVKIAIIILIVAGGVFLLKDSLYQLMDLVKYKQEIKGTNARLAEWGAVYREVFTNPLSMLFGNGGGSTYISPVLAGMRWDSTHSILSFMLLKGGLLGLFIYLSYAAFIIVSWLRAFAAASDDIRVRIALVSLAGCAVMGLLHATFKNISYGFVLAAIPVIQARYSFLSREKSELRQQLDNSRERFDAKQSPGS